MKKYLYSFITLLAAAFTLSSCEDVPEPYALPTAADGGNSTTDLPYLSASCQTGWATTAINGKENPWSQGGSYTQATGYQAWDGGTKTNKEVEGLLISPAFNTTCASGKVLISFDYCVGYANNDPQYADHIKIYATNSYVEGNTDLTQWTEIDWKATHTSTDWTLENTEIQLPEALANKEAVRIIFWFYAPATKSSTFEIKTFEIKEGVAASDSENPENPDTPPTNTNEVLPYSSPSLYAGWITMAANGKGNPWSQGNTYTQATGYQSWGASTKSNKEVDGYLVSPAINTTAVSGNVKMSYEYCVGYANNDANFADHIKVYVSDKFTEGEFNAADWTELDWKATHTSTNWTLETTEIQLPVAFVNKENVHIAFWFYAPAEKSSTFELKNFKMLEGKIGETTPDNPGGGEVSENSITVTALSFGLSNGTSVGTQTLADGTLITFDGGGNTNDPKYYNTGTNIRMYPKNTMKVTAKKKIASIILNCDTYNGVICNASGDISANPGSVKTNEAVVTVTVGSNETTITNTSEQTGTASQIRMVSFTINYAE